MLGWFRSALTGKPSLEKFVAFSGLLALFNLVFGAVFLIGWQLTGNPSGLRTFRSAALTAAFLGVIATSAGLVMFVLRRRASDSEETPR
jgi:hypothetical protein